MTISHLQGDTASPGALETAVTVPAGGAVATVGGPSDVLIGQQWGDFLVGSLLGRGGMGSVYRGKQISLDREVAIKVLPPHLSENQGFRSRFQLEAKAVARLDSPNIIKVYGAGEANGHHYFAMEFVEGDDLAVTVRRNGKPTRQQALGWILQAARGLQAAGELGIVHRDIKPANMMLTKKSVVKLMDFGLVKQGNDTHGGLTMTGTVMGTVSYFSPEQGRGERCDSRTDLYALGIVLYEFLTGKLPFTGEDATSIIYQHIHVNPIPPREVDPSITEDCQGVCLKCMQKNTADRYQTAADLVADLECLVRGDRPDINASEMERLKQGTTLFVPKRHGHAPSSRLLAPLILGAVTVSIAAATAVWLTRTAQPSQPSAAPAQVQIAQVPRASVVVPVQHPRASPEDIRLTPVVTPPVAVQVPVANPPVSVQPVQPAPTPNTPTSGSLATRVQALCAAQRFSEARAVVAAEQAQRPNDATLSSQAKVIDAAEGAILLARARTALSTGNLSEADTLIHSARTVIGPAAEVIELAKDLDARTARLTEVLTKAQTQATAGDAEGAAASLAAAKNIAPSAASIAVAEEAVRNEIARQTAMRTARDAALVAGNAAYVALELERSDAAYTEALRLDPKSQAAAAGRTAVADKRTQLAGLFKSVTDAITARDLPAAEKAHDLLVAAAPSHPATAEAGTRVTTLREELLAEKRAAEALETRRTTRAAALLQACADLQQPIPKLETELAAFLREAGAKRPERAALELAIEDRKQREAVVEMLAALDKAVLAGNAEDITALVKDTTHATALAGLASQPGLVFESALGEFKRSGDNATTNLHIRHALTAFPETTLNYVCELTHTTLAGWTITTARRTE